jgi:hypothetical protein
MMPAVAEGRSVAAANAASEIDCGTFRHNVKGADFGYHLPHD